MRYLLRGLHHTIAMTQKVLCAMVPFARGWDKRSTLIPGFTRAYKTRPMEAHRPARRYSDSPLILLSLTLGLAFALTIVVLAPAQADKSCTYWNLDELTGTLVCATYNDSAAIQNDPRANGTALPIGTPDGTLQPKRSKTLGPRALIDIPCTAMVFWQTAITCDFENLAHAQVDLPPLPVRYLPYPRGLVNDPLTFSLPPTLFKQFWQCTKPDLHVNPYSLELDDDYQLWKICLRWKQVAPPNPLESHYSIYGPYDPAPGWAHWDWDERPWGTPKEDEASGPTILHTYVTSSADDESNLGYERKPHNGPDGRPAYQVVVTTYWILEWEERWQHLVCVTPPFPIPLATCKGHPGQVEFWETEHIGVNGFDMRSPDVKTVEGPAPTHYWVNNTQVQLPDGRVLYVLPVPVIEIQGLEQK
jgi:hypothetical protein